MSGKRAKELDKRVNPDYDKPQTVWREDVEPEDALRELLTIQPPKPEADQGVDEP